MFFLAILSLIWVFLPDPVLGFLDDILILMSATVPLLKRVWERAEPTGRISGSGILFYSKKILLSQENTEAKHNSK